MRSLTRGAGLLSLAVVAAACGDDARRPLGAVCDAIAEGARSVSTEWSEHVIDFSTGPDTASANGMVQLHVGNPDGFAVWIDDVVFEDLGPTPR